MRLRGRLLSAILFLFGVLSFSLARSDEAKAYSFGDEHYTVTYVDTAGNVLKVDSGTKTLYDSILSGYNTTEWYDMPTAFQADSHDPGAWYMVEALQPSVPAGRFRHNTSNSGVLVERFDSVLNNQFTLVAKKVMTDYQIRYVDQSGNLLLPDIHAKIAGYSAWVNLQNQFNATLYDAGSTYNVNISQAYDTAHYIYGMPPRVFVENGHTRYDIVATKKPATPSDSDSGDGTDGNENNTSGNNTSGNNTNGNNTNGNNGGYDRSSTGRTAQVKQGWILQNAETEEWIYYSGTTRSSLKKGWHLDSQDGYWYYLDPSSGIMHKGWSLIGDKWYFFTPYTTQWTWELRNDGEWYYKNDSSIRPLGSMYRNEMTPDGYKVSDQGDYVEE